MSHLDLKGHMSLFCVLAWSAVMSFISHILAMFPLCCAETSSKRFGQLGGADLVLQLYTECLMSDKDKTQAALTLAHTVDACSE